MLRERLTTHGSAVWLVNTGWTGGPYGAGRRVPLGATRAMVRAILSGALDAAECETDPVFGLAVPREVPGVAPELLHPRATWADPAAYDVQARRLAGLFRTNFAPYADQVDEAVRAAGPRG
jgi:phosphoenolpyruvate carboxykinase (ATP)